MSSSRTSAERFGTEQIPVAEDLDLARGIVQVDEHAAVAHRPDAAGDPHSILGFGARGQPGIAPLELGRLMRCARSCTGRGRSRAPSRLVALADPDSAQRVLRRLRNLALADPSSRRLLPLRRMPIQATSRRPPCEAGPRGEIDDRIVETPQGAVMADADDRRPPRRFAQQPVERHLRRLVERRGRLVEKDDLRAGQQNPGEGEPLLLADRQPLRPVAVLVQPVDEIGQADRAQRLDKAVARQFRRRPADRRERPPGCRAADRAAAAGTGSARRPPGCGPARTAKARRSRAAMCSCRARKRR